MILSNPILDPSQLEPVVDILEVVADLEELKASMIRNGLTEASESLSTVISDLEWQIEQLGRPLRRA